MSEGATFLCSCDYLLSGFYTGFREHYMCEPSTLVASFFPFQDDKPVSQADVTVGPMPCRPFTASESASQEIHWLLLPQQDVVEYSKRYS